MGKPDNEALSAVLHVGTPAGIANISGTQRREATYVNNPGGEESPELQQQCMHFARAAAVHRSEGCHSQEVVDSISFAR